MYTHTHSHTRWPLELNAFLHPNKQQQLQHWQTSNETKINEVTWEKQTNKKNQKTKLNSCLWEYFRSIWKSGHDFTFYAKSGKSLFASRARGRRGRVFLSGVWALSHVRWSHVDLWMPKALSLTAICRSPHQYGMFASIVSSNNCSVFYSEWEVLVNSALWLAKVGRVQELLCW